MSTLISAASFVAFVDSLVFRTQRPNSAEFLEAADILNVSRPYLVKLLEQDAIKHRKVGTRRRVLFKDLVEYREQLSGKRTKALDERAAEAQELKLGY